MNWKPYAIMAGVVFLGYTLFNPYLSSALGSIAGSYTAAASAAVMAAGAFWVSKRLEKKI